MSLRLLDLFCGAGGAAMGYHRAGFTEIVGVDIEPQPRYPFKFIQADVIDALSTGWTTSWLSNFDLVHASPPCQSYSPSLRHLAKPSPKLIPTVRNMLAPYPHVIENVKGAPLTGIQLCGSSFGAPLWRHRWFELSPMFTLGLACRHDLVPQPLNPWNTASKRRDGISGVSDPQWKDAMGIDWMTGAELAEAIPPAYTQYIGEQFLSHRPQLAARRNGEAEKNIKPPYERETT